MVFVTWIWMFAGLLATILLIACVKGVSLAVEQLIDMLGREPYLASYAEVIGVGALPLIISLACKDDFRIYGLTREGLTKSLAASTLMASAILLMRALHENSVFHSFNLRFPYNIWYAFLGVFAYGPLEVFFVVWLIVNTDRALNCLKSVFSPGLIITVLAFGLSHVVFSQGGVVNAIKVTTIFFILSLIFKRTGNSIGPMIAWTLINRQVSYLLMGCLM
ncbi:MAG: hypothetical protein DRJ31_02270 [Candidatus Methanomethylicota archaeon]|uniref:CPBP family intramembrane metalloprotease n=1 Tax=Thermoproteota archaeon TaxID=2056631 RepID=A0A497ES65_9CREN|nr:MAG: hypothetical protein DRJ31_02270 [Candidatus Verstraetearchaeota archaeon]